jgi:hypothetical protein
MRNEKRNIDQKTGGRPKILSKIWETGRKKGFPHRCQYVSTTLLHGDLDTPPQVSQVRIRIRIRVKSRIRNRVRVKIQELWRFKMEPWRIVDDHNGGIESQNRAVQGLYSIDQWSLF